MLYAFRPIRIESSVPFLYFAPIGHMPILHSVHNVPVPVRALCDAGLVVGCIEGSGASFAIIQRPKTTWKAVTSQGCGSTTEFRVNGEPVAQDVVVISEDDVSTDRSCYNTAMSSQLHACGATSV